MAIYSQGLRTTNVTIANASVDLKAPSTIRPKVLEVSLIQVTGTASSYGLGRPAANGVTLATTTLFQADDPGDPAALTSLNLTWATSPTAPTIYHRRWNSAATIGVGMVWTFPRGLMMAVSAELVLFNITGTVALDVNFVIDE